MSSVSFIERTGKQQKERNTLMKVSLDSKRVSRAPTYCQKQYTVKSPGKCSEVKIRAGSLYICFHPLALNFEQTLLVTGARTRE